MEAGAFRPFQLGNRHPPQWPEQASSALKTPNLANALEVALHQRDLRTFLLDGDNLRQGLNKDLGFTDADRAENIRPRRACIGAF